MDTKKAREATLKELKTLISESKRNPAEAAVYEKTIDGLIERAKHHGKLELEALWHALQVRAAATGQVSEAVSEMPIAVSPDVRRRIKMVLGSFAMEDIVGAITLKNMIEAL